MLNGLICNISAASVHPSFTILLGISLIDIGMVSYPNVDAEVTSAKTLYATLMAHKVLRNHFTSATLSSH